MIARMSRARAPARKQEKINVVKAAIRFGRKGDAAVKSAVLASASVTFAGLARNR